MTQQHPDGVRAPIRVLDGADSYCPKCGHNRDTSSVSSVDEGNGERSCQKCGTHWMERATDGVQPTAAPSLPELPEALVMVRDADSPEDGGWIVDCDCEGPLTYSLEAGQMLYTEEQMIDYAKQAVAGVAGTSTETK